MRFRMSLVSLVLFCCALPLFAQQAMSNSQLSLGACLARPSVPPALRARYCQQNAVTAPSQRKSNNPTRDYGDEGTFTTFTVPNAVSTYPTGINEAGTIVGTFWDPNFDFHGFVRTKDGSITVIDGPGAQQFTFLNGINSSGATTGYYCDQNFNCPGFVRSASGTFTVLNIPGAGPCGSQGQGINDSGTVTGYWWDMNCSVHEFVLSGNGKFASFDVPGPVYTYNSDIINDKGDVTGWYWDNNQNSGRGFLRTADGTLTLFDGPGGGSTYVAGIDNRGIVAGSTNDGFFRYPDGTFTTSDYPGSNGTGFSSIAKNGAVAGFANIYDNFFYAPYVWTKQ